MIDKMVAIIDDWYTEVKYSLLTNKYTKVLCEKREHWKHGAPHHFIVEDLDRFVVAQVDFQEGPVKENGINGCFNEDLIAMVIMRLEAFQETEFKCRENALAITKLEEALLWLRKRTTDREARGVEGTHTP